MSETNEYQGGALTGTNESGTGGLSQAENGPDAEVGGAFASTIVPPEPDEATVVADSPRADQPAVVVAGPQVSGTAEQVAYGAKVQQAYADGDIATAVEGVPGAREAIESERQAKEAGLRF